MKTTYQIIKVLPLLCPIRDGIIGNTFRRLPMTYRSPRLAQVLANRMNDMDEENGGDAGFYIVETGARADRPSRAGYWHLVEPVEPDDLSNVF